MKKLLTILVCVGMLSFPGVVKADVLTFDDLTANTNLATFASVGQSNYGGFNWSSEWAYMYTTTYCTACGYINGTVSGDYVAFNFYAANNVTIDNGSFDWNGAYFTAAWNTGLNIDIEGWSGGFMVYSTTLVVDMAGPTWFAANWLGIDSISFSSYGGTDANLNDEGMGTHFAMDDFTFNVAVPEPATILLLGSGLIGLAFFRRKEEV